MALTLAAETIYTRLYCGPSQEYEADDVDLVLTNPYAPLPARLRAKPMIVSSFVDRKAQMEAFTGNALAEVGRWGVHQRQAVWVANLDPRPVDLAMIGEEMFAEARGWWPLDLPLRLLKAYGFDWREDDSYNPVSTVWDGFMGRGTTGEACRILGCRFVGIDIDPERVLLAKRYLGV